MKTSKKIPAIFIATLGMAFLLASVSVATAGSKSVTTLNKTAKKELKTQQKTVKKQAETATSAFKGKVNINKADLDTLTKLKGIGPEKAKAIIAYRKKVGSFKKIEDLMQVKGIGEKTFKAIKPFVKVK